MNSTSTDLDEELLRLRVWLEATTAAGPVAVVTGKNGDMDTVGSAIALAASHPSLMACGLHAGRVAQSYIQRHKAPFRQLSASASVWPKKLAGIVVVDAAAPDQTGLELPDVPICVIDHHATDGWTLGERDLLMKWDVRSTTEVVAHYLVAHAPETLSPPVWSGAAASTTTMPASFFGQTLALALS